MIEIVDPLVLKVDSWIENLTGVPPEEQASYGNLLIKFSDKAVSRFSDPFLDKKPEDTARLSLYYMAEWMAWNWWRLCYEPATEEERKTSFNWKMSHRMSAIGHGYVWPDIELASNGITMNLSAKATYPKMENKGFSYLNGGTTFLPIKEFEKKLLGFMEEVSKRLILKDVKESNFQDILKELKREIKDPEISKWRKMEARLGYDPDEGSADKIQKMLGEADRFGESGIDELASGISEPLRFLDEMSDIARLSGKSFQVSADEEIRSLFEEWQGSENRPAWKLGHNLAQAIRKKFGNLEGELNNENLADFANIQSNVFKASSETNLAFLLDDLNEIKRGEKRLILKSKNEMGRRFEFCRLLGNALLPNQGSLQVATDRRTWLQQFQRSFAADLLAPADVVNEMLAGDYSDDQQEGVAAHFNVSPLLISTTVKNNQKIWDKEAA